MPKLILPPSCLYKKLPFIPMSLYMESRGFNNESSTDWKLCDKATNSEIKLQLLKQVQESNYIYTFILSGYFEISLNGNKRYSFVYKYNSEEDFCINKIPLNFYLSCKVSKKSNVSQEMIKSIGTRFLHHCIGNIFCLFEVKNFTQTFKIDGDKIPKIIRDHFSKNNVRALEDMRALRKISLNAIAPNDITFTLVGGLLDHLVQSFEF